MTEQSVGDPAEVFAELKQGHERFLAGHSLYPHHGRERMQEIAEGQHPQAAVLGCADSRVPVELLFDTGLGDLYVERTAGNVAFATTIGSLEYAVGSLGVQLIIVLGHERCGAVTAALNMAAKFTPNLGQLVGQVRLQLLEVGAMDDLEHACRQNALRAAHNLAHSSLLFSDRLRAGKLRIEPGYYDLDTGEIDWLGTVSPPPEL
jgi:carbonic anhydrase